jgi:beta-lactamase regulating signal transducer with metallopeptidase domain
MDIVQTLAGFLAETTAKATLLLVIVCVSAQLLSRSAAAVRHRLWSLTMLSLILLPVASCALPAWTIPILPMVNDIEIAAPDHAAIPSSPMHARTESSVSNEDTPTFHSSRQPIADDSQAGATLLVSEQPRQRPNADVLVLQTGVMTEVPHTNWTELSTVAIWSLGAGLLAMLMTVNVARTIRFCRRSMPIRNDVWCRLLTELSQRLRLRQAVSLREHTEPIVPLTCGVLRPIVLLPPIAHKWDEPLQRTVLTHELAHVKRRDVIFQFIGRLACTLYWFHPLAWYALRKLRQEGEQACDDAVVHSGEKASDYAAQLLRVAELCCAPRGLSHGVAMAEGSNLELRVQSLFDSTRLHGPVCKNASIAMLLVGALTLGMTAVVDPVAATEPASPPAVLTSGDASGQPVEAAPDAPVETSNPAYAPAAEPTKLSVFKYPGSYLHGKDALQRIVDLKPIFGAEQGGLTLGLAYATPQRVFRLGDRMPVELFLMNVSDRVVRTKYIINFVFDTPEVVNSKGERMSVPRLETYVGKRPHNKLGLGPGEAYVIQTSGLGLGDIGPVSFESPTVGKYRFSYRLAGLTSGQLKFDSAKEESGDLRFNGYYASLYSAERMSIIKPAFGKARRGIQMGLAFPTLKREFAMGEKLPLEIYLRNVSDREQTIGFHPDFYWSPPSYVNPRGEKQRIDPLPVWLFEPGLTLTLKPGEAYGVSTPGLWLSESKRGLSLVMPDLGTYRIEYTRPIINGVENTEYWDEELQTAPLPLEVFNNKDGKRSVRLPGATDTQPDAVPWWNQEQPKSQKEPAKQADVKPHVSTPKPAEPEAAATPPPSAPEPSESAKGTSKVDLKSVIWWKKVKGLQAGFLLDSPGLPNLSVPYDSVVKYRILVRNTTDKRIKFMARSVPNDYRDAPFLIPSDNITNALDASNLPAEFRATDGRQGWKYDLAYEMKLGPGESTIIPAHSGSDDLGLYIGGGKGNGLPTIRKVKAGMNWIVQPLQIQVSTEPGYGTGFLFEGLYFQTRIDREGNASREPATRIQAGKGGTILHPRIQLEVGTLNAAATRNAKHAVWGKVDKGLQCGIRLLNPKLSFNTGDTLKAELLWRNTSTKPISSPRPAPLDLYPMLHDADGKYVMIDFGARYRIKPIRSEFQPGAIRSLGGMALPGSLQRSAQQRTSQAWLRLFL